MASCFPPFDFFERERIKGGEEARDATSNPSFTNGDAFVPRRGVVLRPSAGVIAAGTSSRKGKALRTYNSEGPRADRPGHMLRVPFLHSLIPLAAFHAAIGRLQRRLSSAWNGGIITGLARAGINRGKGVKIDDEDRPRRRIVSHLAATFARHGG